MRYADSYLHWGATIDQFHKKRRNEKWKQNIGMIDEIVKKMFNTNEESG